MFDDTGLPNSASSDMESDGPADAEAPAAAPPRFGRLALCVAAVSALAIGVMGTVAYGMWFNHDQQAYAAAMAGARQALGNTASATAAAKAATAYTASVAAAPATAVLAKSPALSPSAAPAPVEDPEQGGPLASWSGQVTGHAALKSQAAAVADAAPAASAPSSGSALSAASAGNPPAQQVAAARPGKEARATPAERRGSYANTRHKDSLFARLGQFLRRVSYRQHGNPSRQDNYSHP